MPLIPPSPERHPPTAQTARTGAMIVTRPVAELLDDHTPIIGPCARRGHWSRVCIVRLTGAQPMRIRITITTTPDHDYLARGRII